MKKLRYSILLVLIIAFGINDAEAQGWFQLYPNSNFPFTACQQTFDGGYVLARRGQNNFHLVKTDPNGILLWDSLYSYTGVSAVTDLIQTQDSGLVVLETSHNSGNKMIKVSQQGTYLWEQSPLMAPQSILELNDQSLVVCGDSSNFYARVAKFDNLANPIWSSTYPSFYTNIFITGARDIKQTPDGGFATIAYKQDSIQLIKTDANGVQQWASAAEAFGGFWGNTYLAKVLNTSDGGYLVGLNFFTFPSNYRIFLHKFDSLGNYEGFQIIGDAGDYFQDLINAPDGGYIAVGYTSRNNPTQNSYWESIFITKIAPDATYREWERIIGDTAGYYQAHSVNTTSDGGYIIAGGGLALKLDSLGGFGISCGDTTYLSAQICNGDTFTVGSSTYTQPGTYTNRFVTVEACDSIVITNLTGVFATDSMGNPLVQITGTVYEDNGGGCVYNSGDNPLAGWVVEAEGGGNTIYATTDSMGQYSFLVPYGTYDISAQTPANWLPCGASTQTVTLDSSTACSMVVDIGMQPDYDCALLDLDLSIICLVPCSTSTYHLNYHNIGTSTAYDPVISFVAGPFITVDWSSVPWITPQSGSVYDFHLDSVPAGASGWIAIAVTVDCNASLEDFSVCSGAIHDASQCCPDYDAYGGAQIELEAQCLNNDSIEFLIKNTGAGNMLGDLDYFILQDDIVYAVDIFNLPSQGVKTVRVEADGFTYRLEAQQEPIHPYLPAPAISVEGCGGAVQGMISLGYSDILENGDQIPSIDFTCTPITEDCSCNQIYGSPLGVDEQHFITAEDELEYTIRFQNQGSGIAQDLVIIDTLPEELDPMSIIKGESSHDFGFTVYGDGIVKWEMKDINLAPGTPGTMENSGFVKFTAGLKSGLADGTVINNKAEIYFDASPAIATNKVFHTLGERFVDFLVPLGIDDIKDAGHVLRVFPNPFNESTTIEIKGVSARQIYIEIHDLEGKLVQRDVAANNHVVKISRYGLADGMYTYRVIADGEFIGTGKLVVGGAK